MRDISGSFGSANAEAVFNGNVTAVPTTVTAEDATIPSSTVDKIDGYLDNLATEEINERDFLNRLFDKNEQLATTNATTLAKKRALLTNAANSGGGSTTRSDPAAAGGSATSEVLTLKRQVQQLRAAIRFKWANGGF